VISAPPPSHVPLTRICQDIAKDLLRHGRDRVLSAVGHFPSRIGILGATEAEVGFIPQLFAFPPSLPLPHVGCNCGQQNFVGSSISNTDARHSSSARLIPSVVAADPPPTDDEAFGTRLRLRSCGAARPLRD